MKQTHPVPQIDVLRCSLSDVHTATQTGRWTAGSRGQTLFTLSLIQSVAAFSLTYIFFLAGGRHMLTLKPRHGIWISYYRLTYLVLWDNTTFHRVTLLGWSKTAYFRHRESSNKLYPKHH